MSMSVHLLQSIGVHIAACMRTQISIGNWFASDANLGGTVGVKNVTLSIAQIPAHSHQYSFLDVESATAQSGSQHGIPSKANRYDASSTGGGQSHNNMQPSLYLNYLIKV